MDQYFNTRAARWAERLVSKLDDESAASLISMVTYDVLYEDIAKNRRALDSFTEEVETEVAKRVAKALTRVEVDDDHLIAATALISKSRPGDPFNRDNRGRFASTETRGGRSHVGLAERLNRRGRRMSTFQETWNERAMAHDNARTYRRVQAGAELLGNTAGGRNGKQAAQFGQFVGQYGPEAEKVVGPSIRRAAYRYRGTERKIDSDLIKLINDRSKNVMAMRQPNVDPAKRTLDPKDREETARSAAVLYLLQKLPSRSLSSLQLSSGKTPPSQGFILNADGKVITQAVGYADDHYLPFNLKNLQGLKGGSYIRSRAFGGPTTEDIYTGLVSGASSVTVVSHSGVFTIDFDENFKGARRYNDKAAQMVSRYAKLLDAINSEQIERQPISWDDRVQIRDEVEQEMRGFNRAEIEGEIKRRENEFRTTPQLTPADMRDIDEKAKAAAEKSTALGRTTEERYKRARAELISDALEAKASNKYRLDGVGYKSALNALQEQFPYYIKNVLVENKETNSALGTQFSPATDRGYVAPKYLRPAAALEGYYDPTIQGPGSVSGTGKTPAKYTNYANWRNNPLNKPMETAELPEEDEAGKESAAPRRRGAANLLAESRAASAKVEAAKTALRGAVSELHAKVEPQDKAALQPYLEEGDFDSAWFDPMKRSAMVKAVEDVASNYEAEKLAGVYSKLESYRSLTSSSRATQWTEDAKLGESPATPFAFTEPAYEPVADQSRRDAEWVKLTHGWTEGYKSGQYSDAQLRTKAAAFGNVANWADQVRSGTELDKNTLLTLVSQMNAAAIPERTQEMIVDAMDTGNTPVLDGIVRQATAAAKNVERMRRLQANATAPEEIKERVTTAEVKTGQAPRPLAVDMDNDEVLSTLAELADDLAQQGRQGDGRAVQHLMEVINEVEPTNASKRTYDRINEELDKFKDDTAKYSAVARLRRRGFNVPFPGSL